jgi:hypothetical protein
MGAHGTLLSSTDSGVTWNAVETGVVSPFLGVAAASPLRLWAAGGDGSVFSITSPDPGAITAAGHLPEILAVLRSFDISDATIGQPLTDFAEADSDLTTLTALVERDRAALAAPVEVTVPAVGNPPLFHDLMFLTIVNRIGSALFVLIAAAIVGAVVRRAMRLGVQFDASADALILGDGVIGDSFARIARALSPTGSVPPDLAVSPPPHR